MTVTYCFMLVNRIRDMGGLLNGLACTQRLRRGEDCIFNGRISRTATERILERKTNISAIWIRIVFEQCVGRHDLSRDAESTLHRAMFDKGFLQWMQPRAERSHRRHRSIHLLVYALSEPLDGDDSLSICALRGIDARDNRLTINNHSTRAAFCFLTTNLCAGKLKPLAKESGEGLACNRFERILLAINGKIYVRHTHNP